MSTKHGDKYQANKFATIIIKCIGQEFSGNTESPTDIFVKVNDDYYFECKSSKKGAVGFKEIAKAIFQLYRFNAANAYVLSTFSEVKKEELLRYFNNINSRGITWEERYIKKILDEYNLHQEKIIDLVSRTKLIYEPDNYSSFIIKSEIQNQKELMDQVKKHFGINISNAEADAFLEKIYSNYQGTEGPIDISSSFVKFFFKYKKDNIYKIKDIKRPTTIDEDEYNEILWKIKSRLSEEYLQFCGIQTELEDYKKEIIEEMRDQYEKL